jgi:hypothetical protein
MEIIVRVMATAAWVSRLATALWANSSSCSIQAGEGAGGLQVGVHEPPGNGDRVAVGSEAAALVDADEALYGAAGAFGVDELKRRGRVEQIERAIVKNAKSVEGDAKDEEFGGDSVAGAEVEGPVGTQE